MDYRETFVFPVHPDHVRAIADPNTPSIKTTYALVNVLDFDTSISLSPNPRVPKENKVVARIVGSLKAWDGLFHILNRGITISAKAVDYDSQNRQLTVVIPYGEDNYGVLDGGHTMLSIANAVSGADPDTGKLGDQYVRLEILEGIEDILPRVAGARNFSERLSELSLKTYEHRLQWLKQAVKPYAEKVSWFQNDPGNIDAMELLQILTAMNPFQFDRYKQPIEAYKNAGKCLEYATADGDPHRYHWLASVALDIWRLYDTIRDKWWDNYRLPDPITGKPGRPRATLELSQRKRGKAKLMQYVTLGKEGDPEKDFHVEKGLAIPLLSGFRALLHESPADEMYTWKRDPFDFLNSHGQVLVRKIMEASDQRGKNPNTVGRDQTVYDSIYEAVELRLLRNE